MTGTSAPKRATAAAAATGRARARAKSAKVVQEAGAEGHIVPNVPEQTYRTDLVPPMLSFVVYGVPSPQGSKAFAGFQKGKPILKEQSDGVGPWREAVRRMSVKAIREHVARTGAPWVALDEPVMLGATITLPATDAASKRGDVFATGTPDLDKLQRAIGDALAPSPLDPSVGKGMPASAARQVRDKAMAQRRANAVLHDDSRVAVWANPTKVYPGTTVDSLGFAGVTIRVWRLNDLLAAANRPVVSVDGREFMSAADLRAWGRPSNGASWDEVAEALWADPAAVLGAGEGPVVLKGRAVSREGALVVLRALALRGPGARVEVVEAVRG